MQRILVVDDFKAWRDEACEIIESQPELQVIAQAEDGEEAVQLATDLKPDLVGLAAAACIFEASPGIKIVFFSQDNDPDIVRTARNMGASEFVHKVKANSDLLNAVTAALETQRREEFYICPLCTLPGYT